jgi:hypothetical protein
LTRDRSAQQRGRFGVEKRDDLHRRLRAKFGFERRDLARNGGIERTGEQCGDIEVRIGPRPPARAAAEHAHFAQSRCAQGARRALDQAGFQRCQHHRRSAAGETARTHASPRGSSAQPREARFEIRDQIIGVFQPRVDAKQRPLAR